MARVAHGTSPAVLLVEDDRLTRVVVRDSLKQCGFKGTPCLALSTAARGPSVSSSRSCLDAVDIAENGQVAMEKLSKARRKGNVSYGLILTDIYMPKVRPVLVPGVQPHNPVSAARCQRPAPLHTPPTLQIDGEELVSKVQGSAKYRHIPVAGATPLPLAPEPTDTLAPAASCTRTLPRASLRTRTLENRLRCVVPLFCTQGACCRL